MSRVLIRAGKSPFQVRTPEQFIRQDLIGTNSGNLVFSDSVFKTVSAPGVETSSTPGLATDASAANAARINASYDLFVIPLANAFRPSWEGSLRKLTTLVEQLTIPVAVIGVGAQANADYSTRRLEPMADSVRAFMRAVLERSASVGVRGELTARYLAELGFGDDVVEVIGCPSMFHYGPYFPAPRPVAEFGPGTRLAVNFSEDAAGRGPVTEMVDDAHRRFPDLLYFAQNLRDAKLLFWGDTSVAAGTEAPFPRLFSHPLVREGKTRVPLDPVTWMAELRRRDFSYGTRIHGNITALLAGTPAVVLGHDSRTIELCRYFAIPHRQLPQDAGTVPRPEELYASADYRPMLAGHGERYRRYASFLARNRVPNTFAEGGDGGTAFEDRMSRLDFPAPLRPWQGEDDGHMAFRIGWLHQRALQYTADKPRIAALSKENAELRERLEAVERRLAQLGIG